MAEWKDRMAAEVRELRLEGEIVFGSGRRQAIAGEMICGLSISEGADGELAPGSVLSATCTLELANDQGQWSEGGSLLGGRLLRGATLMLRIGAAEAGALLWQDLGVFQIERAICMDAQALMRIEASDSIAYELNGGFQDDLQYPVSLEALWRHALGQTRYIWNGTVPNGNAIIDAQPDWKDTSLRGVLGWIAAAAGSFVRVNRSGTLELCPLTSSAVARVIPPQSYLSLQCSDSSYGPVDALRVKAQGADAERVYRVGETALYTLSVSGNPLFQNEAPGLDALAQGMLDVVAGFENREMDFTWRGDPTLNIGDRVSVTDPQNRTHAAVLTRQTLRFAQGFSASCSCAVPRQDSSGMRRLITPEGGLNAAALTGAVDGELLSVGSVTANKIAARAITAEKLEAVSVDAHIVSAVQAKFESLDANNIETDALGAELARIGQLITRTADIGFGQIKDLVAGTAIITEGVGGQLFISRLAVTEANMVSLTVGELVVKGADGSFYAVGVGEDGQITTTLKQIANDDVKDLSLNAGEKLIEGSVTAACLNANDIFANNAIIRQLIAANIDVATLFANNAFVSELYTSQIFGGKSIQMIAGEAAAAQDTADAANGTVQKTVKTVDVEYYLSSSPTELAGGSWSTMAPPWVDGKYMWSRTTTILQDGSVSHSNITCIAGAKGETGAQGLQGLQGPQGEQGIPGPAGANGTDGADGRTSYFHIKYSEVAKPTSPSQMTETPSTYIGTYVDYTAADSSDPGKYTWARFQGLQGAKGEQGIPGVNGANGQTSYLHIKYSNDGGATFTANNGETPGDYIGQYTDFTLNDSTSVSAYKWAKIKGATGATGNGIASIAEEFYLSTSKETQTGGSWQGAMPAWSKGKYVWTRSRITYTDGSTAYTEPYCDTGWEAANDAQEIAEAATIHNSDEPPAPPIAQGFKWIDTGIHPWQLRQWRGADLPQLREFTAMDVGTGGNLIDPRSFSPSPDSDSVKIAFSGNYLRVYTTGSGGTWRGASTPDFILRGGVSYVLRGRLSAYTSGAARLALRRADDNAIISAASIDFGSTTGANYVTFALPETQLVYLSALCTNGTLTSGDVTFSQLQLEPGTAPTAYTNHVDHAAAVLDNAVGQLQAVAATARHYVPGKNMADVGHMKPTANAQLEISLDRVRVCTTGSGGTWQGASTPDFWLLAGETYTLSGELVSATGGHTRIAVRRAEGNTIIGEYSLTFSGVGAMTRTFTPEEDIRAYITAFCTDGNIISGDVTYRRIQLETGAVATAYAAHSGFDGCTSVELRACSNNMVDMTRMSPSSEKTKVVHADDSIRVSTTSAGAWQGANGSTLRLIGGVTYILSGTLSVYRSGDARIGLRGLYDHAFLPNATLNFGSETGKKIAKFTPTSDVEAYASALCTGGAEGNGDVTFSRIQLEASESATVYERYQELGGGTIRPNAPLYGIYRSEDMVELERNGSVRIRHNTAVAGLNGLSASSVAAAQGAYAYCKVLTGAMGKNDFPVVCSHFRVLPYASATSRHVPGTMMAGLSSSGVPMIWVFTEHSTVDQLNAWLKTQAADGRPVTLVYALETPVEEPVAHMAPVAPQPGRVNLQTGLRDVGIEMDMSGWSTINDSAEIEAALGEAGLQAQEALDAANAVAENLERRVRLDPGGLHVGDSQTDNELLMQSALIHFVINGTRVSTIAADYHRFGNMEIRTPSSAGGIVIQAVQ